VVAFNLILVLRLIFNSIEREKGREGGKTSPQNIRKKNKNYYTDTQGVERRLGRIS